MDNLYREQILDHYKHPRNFGHLPKANAVGSDSLVSCGDRLSLELLVDNKSKKVTDVKFQGVGCAISMASASLLSERIKGEKVDILQRLTKDDILKLIGVNLTPTRLKCALLSLEVLHKALANNRR